MTTATTQPVKTTAPASALRFIGRRDDLAAALKLLRGSIKERWHNPILQCVHLIGTDRALRLHATNLEQAMVVTLEQVQIEHAGEAAVSCEDLLAVVDGAQSETVNLRMDGEELLIEDEAGVFRLATCNPKDFPPEPTATEGAAMDIAAPTVVRLVQQTAYAIADNPTRYALNGAFVESNGKVVRAVATEGRFMAVSETAIAGPKASALAPRKAWLLMRQMAEEVGDGDTRLVITENGVAFTCGSTLLYSVLVEGQFVPWQDTLNGGLVDSKRKFTAAREELAHAIRRASMLSRDKENDHAPLRLEFGKQGMTAKAQSSKGSALVQLAARYEGEPLTIGISGRNLLAGIQAADADEVVLHLTAPNRPLVLKAGDYTFLCSPLNLE